MSQRLAVALLLCSVAYIAAEKTYKGYKLYDINAKNEFEKQFLLQLSANRDYDFFTLPEMIGKVTRVLVKPEVQLDFEASLTAYHVEYTIVDDDLGRSLEEERLRGASLRTRLNTNENSKVSFSRYLSTDEINAYLDELAINYPNRVMVETVGKSYENRDIKSITITNGDGRTDKKVILIDGGIHAREWITPATALYVIKQLVENFPENTHLLQNYDWVVLPEINPDGYNYSHVADRFWRGNRAPVTDKCVGTNLNRNFDFHWAEGGVSKDPCNEHFMGKAPFSEIEARILRDVMHSLSGRAKMYLTIHSYGKCLVYPWAYTRKPAETWKDLYEVAKVGTDAIRAATGTIYRPGSVTEILGLVGGTSVDYAYAVTKIPFSYAVEMPPGGVTGFHPTPEEILPLASEAWIGIKAMAERLIEKY